MLTKLLIALLIINPTQIFGDEINTAIGKDVLPYILQSQNELKKALSPQLTCSTLEVKSTCPPFLIDLLKDNYKGGTVGLINKFTSDGLFSSPDKICKNNTSFSKDDFIKKLNSANYTAGIPTDLLSRANACVEALPHSKFDKDQKERAQKFIMSSLVYMPLKIESSIKNMLEAKSQIDMMMGQEVAEKCDTYPTPALINYCHKTEDCKYTSNKIAFDNKAAEITNALQSIQTLNAEVIRLRVSGKNPQRLKQLEVAIVRFKLLYPMITHSSFKESFSKIYNPTSKISEVDVRAHLKKEFNVTRKRIAEKLTSLRQAHQCVDGSRSHCNDVEKLLNETNPYWKPDEKIPTNSYYACVADIKDARDSANKLVNASLVGPILMLTPVGILGASKILYESGKLIKAASTVAKIKHTALVTGLTTDVAISEIETTRIYDSCRKKLTTLSDLDQQAPTCQAQEMKVALTSDINKCHQQIITSALSIISTGVGVGLAKMNLVPVKAYEELNSIMAEFLSRKPSSNDRKQFIMELNKRLSKINKNKEYTPEEIQSALKVYLKKCDQK